MTNLTTILNEIADAFRKDKRNDGTEFYRLKDGVDDNGCADWLLLDASVCDVGSFMLRIHSAVDDRGPDDWVYEHTYRMAQSLAESCEYHTRRSDGEWDADEAVEQAADVLTDVYTMDRLKWLAMNLHNFVMVDEACEEMQYSLNPDAGISDRIAIGQSEVLRRIGQAIISEAQQELARREEAES